MPTEKAAYTIRPPQADDHQEWLRLYKQYTEFYRMPWTETGAQTVWGWLFDDTHVLEGLVADTDTGLIGLAHFRAMPSPLRARDIGFLDDLFIDPGARGAQLGERLIAHLADIAKARGWPTLRWLTADDNYRARTLYDRVAKKTHWNTYSIEIE